MASGGGATQVKSMDFSRRGDNKRAEKARERRKQFTPRKRTSESENDGTCDLCVQAIKVYAVGYCDHPICHRCSVKMRNLCEQNHCAVCRTEMKKVIYCKSKRLFEEVNALQLIRHKKNNVYFTDDIVRKEYEKLFDHPCPVCTNHRTEDSFDKLEVHVRKDHKLYYCSLCVRHNTNFTDECKTYTREGLAKHRRVGDDDDTSHRGHPLCEFCDDRYLDTDTLLKHLRKDHYFCHFCDAAGKNQYYDEYVDLRDHYKKDHFLCEEGDCINEQFTSVFASELDLKAHRSAAHNQGLSKQQLRVERNIDLGFQYADRPTRGGRGQRNEAGGGRGRGRGRGDKTRRDDDLELAKAISLSEQNMDKKGSDKGNAPKADRPRVQRDQPKAPPPEKEIQPLDLQNDFPSLGASDNGKQPDPKPYPSVPKDPVKPDVNPSLEQAAQAQKLTAATKVAAGRSMGSITRDDFPTLGSTNTPGVSQPTGKWAIPGSAGPGANSVQPTQPKASKPVSVNMPYSKFTKSNVDLKNKEDFPTLGGGRKPTQSQTSTGIWGSFTAAPITTSTRRAKKPKTPLASQPAAAKKQPPPPKPSTVAQTSSAAGSAPDPMAYDETVSIRIGSHKHTMRLTSAKHSEEISDIEKPIDVPGVKGTSVKTVSMEAFSLLSSKSALPNAQSSLLEQTLPPQMNDFPELGSAKGGRIRGIGSWKTSSVDSSGQKSYTSGQRVAKKPSLANLSKDIVLSDRSSTKSGSPNVFPSAEDDFPQITKPPPLSSYAADWHGETYAPVAAAVIKEGSFHEKEDDFPSISATAAVKNPRNGGKKNKKKKKKTQLTATDLSKHFGNVLAESENQGGGHLESLLQENDAKVSLSAMLDKDDMFSPVDNDVSRHPGDAASNGDVTVEGVAEESNEEVREFELEPRPEEDDIQGRNMWLITTIRQLCGDEENFSEFKSVSGGFRQGKITSEQYYAKCKILLGKRHFNAVFQELVDLLPDDDKRESLMQVHATW